MGISIIRRVFFLLFVLVSSVCTYTPLQADDDSSGQNPLKPVSRFEVRHRFETFDKKSDENSGRIRFEEQISTIRNWRYALRVDLRMLSEDDEDSSTELSDMFIEGRAIKRDGDDSYGFGLRHIIRFADQDAGGEKWDLAPILGYSKDLDIVERGSFVRFLTRYRFSVVGAESRVDRNRLELIPAFNVHFGELWFAEIVSDTRLDFEQGNSWDVPVGIRVGRDIGKKWVLSVEPRYYFVNDARGTDFFFESRINYFFNSLLR